MTNKIIKKYTFILLINLLFRHKVIKTRFIVITWAEIYTSNEGWTEKEFELFALVVELVCPCQIVISRLSLRRNGAQAFAAFMKRCVL
jgi:hypothetical protein